MLATSKKTKLANQDPRNSTGFEFAGDEVGEVADLHRNIAKCADDKAGNASRVVEVHLCLDGPSCVRVRAVFCVELLGSFFDFFFVG